MENHNWSEFWKKESDSFFKIMRMSTSVFADRFKSKFYLKDSHLLDFGCGPGFLIDKLNEPGIQITGVDINDYFIRMCKQKHPTNYFFMLPALINEQDELLKERFRDLKFDWIVLLSISQYYSCKEEFYQAVDMLSQFLKAEGSLIIADVITPSTSSVPDLISVGKQSIRTGNFFNMIRFIAYLLFSNYQKTSSDSALLKFDNEDFLALSNRLSLRCTLHPNLTLHPTRRSYCLKR